MKSLLIIVTHFGLASCTSNVTVDDVHYGAACGVTAPKERRSLPPGANPSYVPKGKKCSPPGTYPDRHDDTNSSTKYLNKYQYPKDKPNHWTD